MLVPETAMDENDSTPARQNDIGPAWEVPAMQAKPQPFPVKECSNDFFGFRILPANAGHHPAARNAIDYICQMNRCFLVR
jgi:hypothetical protein